MLEACDKSDDILTVYGHPHSLSLPGPQNCEYLEPFLADVSRLRAGNRLRISEPRVLLNEV
jgi:hypothetical protein